MAIYRSVNISFWTDTKVNDNFTPEDKYFMLYCLTNEHTNICGCYEISIKQMSSDLGYNRETIEQLLNRFINIHKVLDYDYDTKEIFIKNWYKYNWTSSNKIEQAIIKSINEIKSEKFRNEIIDIYNSRDTLSIPYQYPSDTTDTDTVSITDTITIIINYLNNKLNSNYRKNNKETIKHIKARLNEKYTVDDFKKVIDIKYDEWHDTEMQKYLRPDTLFGIKFESYLNQKGFIKKEQKETLNDLFKKMEEKYDNKGNK